MSEEATNRKIVLGIDIGTTNIKCLAYDHCANIIGKAHEEVTVLNPSDGRHEIKPASLWNAFQSVVNKCLLNSHLYASEISCLGISTQRASFVTWNRETQEVFHNFITWKDRRCEQLCEDWNASILIKLLRFGARLLYFVTRKKLFQLLSALKFTSAMVLTRLCWIMKYNIQIRNQILQDEALFGTIDTWLIWKLTGGKVHATDPSNACVTGFFDPIKMEWSNLVLRLCGIPRNMLPDIKNTSDFYGEILPDIFGATIPIYAVVGDQQAALFGAGCFLESDINCTMGTGTFINVNTGCELAPAFSGVYPLIGWTISSKTTYILECGMHDVGTVLSVAKNLGLFNHPSESSQIAKSVLDSDGVYFLPSACLLESAGKRNVNMSSLIGLKAHTSKEHIVTAILESLAFQVRLLLDSVEKSYVSDTKVLRVCGGIAKNDFVIQLASDLNKKSVQRLKHSECSSLGAAYLAGLHYGIWNSLEEITTIQTEYDMFFPDPDSAVKYKKTYRNWKKAVTHPFTVENSI